MSKSKDLTTIDSAAEVMKRLFAQTLKTTKTYKMFPAVEMQHGIKKPKFEIDGHDEAATFNATVVNFTTGREYYPSKDVNIPECTSVGGENGTTYGKCKTCNFFKWGSGDGTKGRKCKEHRKVLLSIEGKPGVFEMKIPTSSLKAFDSFKDDTALKDRVPLQMVIAKFGLTTVEQTGMKPYSTLTLEKVKPLPEASQEFIDDTIAAVQKYEQIYQETPEGAAGAKSAKPDGTETIDPLPADKVSDKVTVAEGDEVPF